ncbi:hypothetical protein VE00_02005 [Pseudogymnoascus sp. WSF 3629]|nr:hypothetical protein VE00_02005 [Pseudogymnoascus sp. WSF 3629]
MSPKRSRNRRTGPISTPDSKTIKATTHRIITPQPHRPRHVKPKPKNADPVPKPRWEVITNASTSFSDWISRIAAPVLRAVALISMAVLFLYALWSNWVLGRPK